MGIGIIRLLFDFGLLVLIWLVQLLIYPSFKFYSAENLLKWHKKYTLGISLIVIPLMLGQLLLGIIQLTSKTNSYTIISMVLITIVWCITFIKFVPIHNNIATGKSNNEVFHKLVKLNWFRTILWTIIFFYTAVILG